MSKINEIYHALVELEFKNKNNGITASELGLVMNLDRANISRYLNQLHKAGKVIKVQGRPVRYRSENEKSNIASRKRDIIGREDLKNLNINRNSLDLLVGAEISLQVPIQQAKAAILYPPRGLHTLILGETGVGKSMFAELMYEFSKESGVISENAPFIRFNCADYGENPQLLISQIFGVKKGAYTGADTDKVGLLKKADGGIIFLDEVHRLSPQGQEMLFTYIDKGYFRPLGETEVMVKSETQIITATTEEPQSYLLRTFTRRIPMTITLPALAERTIKERYCLLREFIKGESKRVGKSIYVDKNALVSFLLYDCPNNIGQLKSDIQLACAKAFLNYKTRTKDFIIVNQSDLLQSVKLGLMKIQQFRNEVNELLENVGDVLKFSYKDDFRELELSISENDLNRPEYFYDIIEEKLEELKSQGLGEKEISQIINIDIERYFKKYIKNLPDQYRKEELLKIVDIEIVDLVEEILSVARRALHREFDEKVYFGLAFHLQGSIERILQGNKIYHPKLNFIRAQYADEFLVAMEVAKLIDSKFNIQVPLDEIGYLTMFLASSPYDLDEKQKNKVAVLVIMHGHSTASSMVEVANSLIGEECVIALDMPLSMKAENMYKLAKEKIIEIDKGKGILLLVDMGSLTNFSDMISEETGTTIKTIDMVSTLLVIEAGRKAINGRDLEEVYKSCMEVSRVDIRSDKVLKTTKKLAIITSCFTGEGSAEKLKEILIQKMCNSSKIDIIPLNILDREDFVSKIENIKKKYNIIGIVSAINFKIKDVKFISAPDIFVGEGIELLEKTVDNEEDFLKIAKSLEAQMEDISGAELVENIRTTMREIQEILGISINHEVEVGIVIHLCFLIERLMDGERERNFDDLNEYRSEYSKEFILIKQSFKKVENIYNVNIGENEVAFIIRMFTENLSTV